MDFLRNSRSEGGQIQLILGPMFSGKSTELMRRVKRYQIGTRKCLTIKYAKDKRYSSTDMSTHDSQTISAISVEKLWGLRHRAKDFEVIGIDEGQFFPDIVEFSETMANLGKVVIISALDGTFQRKKFNQILELVPLAECVMKLNAVCMMCAGEAAFTKRIKTNDNRLEVIGGTEMYMATCRECFNKTESEELERHPLNENVNIENIQNVNNENVVNIEYQKEKLKA